MADAPDTHSFVIWSHEHNQWWAPNHSGYTSDLKKAGRYSFREAAEITVDHCPAGEEVALRLDFAETFGTKIIYRCDK